MAKVPILQDNTLQAICNVLGDTSAGLTGREIGQILSSCGIDDPNPDYAKRDRLFEALSQRQRRDGCGDNVAAFIFKAMAPVRYIESRENFEKQRAKLNQALSFAGLSLGEDGQLRIVTAARTLSEAKERAGRLRKMLQDRRVHQDVLRFCRAELLQDNYFHAVFEATKSVADKIRDKSGLTSDGARLVDQAFGIGPKGYPLLAFNTLQTETEQSEHTGLMNLIKGLFGTFRNTTAHAPKIKWVIQEQDALDMMSLASLLHRRLDQAVRTQPRGSIFLNDR